MQLLVNLFGKTTQAVELSETTTVGQLKNLISNDQSVSAESLILSSEGTAMIDDYLISLYNPEIISVDTEVLGEGKGRLGIAYVVRVVRIFLC